VASSALLSLGYGRSPKQCGAEHPFDRPYVLTHRLLSHVQLGGAAVKLASWATFTKVRI
jgi:hypothetical protein